MEKKYIEANVAISLGKPLYKMVFDDVRNYSEVKDSTGKITHFEFDDADGHYSYDLKGRNYAEAEQKAFDIRDFRMICRRTALKHGLLDNRRREEVKPGQWR